MIKILLAEDVHMVRCALTALLSLEPDLSVVGEVADGNATCRSPGAPDVAVLDIDLPGKDGITAVGELRVALPDCRILMLTSRPAGHRPQGARRRHRRRRGGLGLHRAGQPAEFPGVEILQLAAEGAPAHDIAATLFLSVGTVRNYLPRSSPSSRRAITSTRSGWRARSAGSESVPRRAPWTARTRAVRRSRSPPAPSAARRRVDRPYPASRSRRSAAQARS